MRCDERYQIDDGAALRTESYRIDLCNCLAPFTFYC